MTPDQYAARHAEVDEAAILRRLLGIWRDRHALVFGEAHGEVEQRKGDFLGRLLRERCKTPATPAFFAPETAFDVTAADLARLRAPAGEIDDRLGETDKVVVRAARECPRGRPAVLPFGSPIMGTLRDKLLADALNAVFTLQRASTIYRHDRYSVPVIDPLLQDLYQGIILMGSYHALHASPLSEKGRPTGIGHGERSTMELLADRARPHVTLLLTSKAPLLDPQLDGSLSLSGLLTNVAKARKAQMVYPDLGLPGSPFNNLHLAAFPTGAFDPGIYSKLPVTKLFDAVLLLYVP